LSGGRPDPAKKKEGRMSRITVITKIRFLAGVAPVVMLVAAPMLAMAFSALGRVPAAMNNNEIAALSDAQGLDEALYKMQWGRSQPDGGQIVLDQQRRFAELMDSAAANAYTAEQRRALDALAAAAKPTLDAFRKADPRDPSVEPAMAKLHGLVIDLVNADESALARVARMTRSRGREFAILTLIVALVIPWTCFALLFRIAGQARVEMRAIRARVESLVESPQTAAKSVGREVEEIDASLARLGFPKPNPMLAED
jgi:hypothetical protein